MRISKPDAMRHPIGEYSAPEIIGGAQREEWIDELERLPANLRTAVAGLSDEQLDTRYRPDGWTIRQVVHHLADGHLNSYTRFRLALTEDTPTIKPFDETAWAELPDAKSGPIEPSLKLLEGLHQRWVLLFRSLSDEDFKRAYRHPDRRELTILDATLGYFAWHSRHHVAQITGLRDRQGW